jgi:condensin complex subunit 3
VYNNKNEYIRVILELVSDIYEPLEDDADLASQDVQEARLQTCLSMVLELLEKTSKDLSHSGIRDVFQNLITPSLTSVSATVRRDGFKCLGLYCLLDKEKTRQKLPIFLRGLQVEKNDEILLTITRNLFDILLVFGASFAVVPDKDGKEENIIDNLRDFLKHENQDIRMSAVEGFCKLLFTATIHDVDILTDLVEEFLNPLTERFVKIRKCLQEFFSRFASI